MSAPRPPRWQRVTLALLPVLLLVGGWELTLHLRGDAPLDTLHLSRGFDASARYIVPDPEVDGGWRTQVFGGERITSEVSIPPKGNGPRVILFGGSNTELLPAFLLQEELRARDAREWEVINLGRRGYGSERVRILLDQAFVLQPDLIVIYSGHNEFVERGFAAEVAEATGSSWLPRLRSVEQVRGWLAALRPGAVPETLDRRDPTLRELQPEETTRHLQAYEANLRHMLRAAHARGIPALIATPLGNPLVSPYVTNLPDHIPESEALRLTHIVLDARRRLPARLFADLRPVGRPPLKLRVNDWHRPPAFADQGALGKIPLARPLTGRYAVAPALDRGSVLCDSMEGSHWPPVEQWQASVHQVLRSVVPLLARAITSEERAQLEALLPLYDEVLSVVPDHPGALFDLALVHWLLDDDPADAVAMLRAAVAADRGPRAANDRTNAIVRRVASEEPGATLDDFEAEARAASSHGLPGFELLMDNCHLQPGVRVILMQRWAEQIPALLP
ncbi:MAG: hypothetical protein DHS20C15_25980 [Planctomycetota bacterium]|nr:MAG: hypothetical protein DHS20C15_25980 [Planctomycetota bacterium]